jgi:hypothetical protein
MQIIKKILTFYTHQVYMELPDEFLNRKIELIILSCTDDKEPADRHERLLKIYNESRGSLPEKYRFDREEAHER